METTQNYPNLLSEKQAAKRLGIARITLLRARQAGRIRFFRIGTRVLYCAEHLTEFLNNCERNSRRTQAKEREGVSAAPRKENRVSPARGSIRERDPRAKTDRRKKEQASLPFAASR
jgi:excisionase family DNA binding protein